MQKHIRIPTQIHRGSPFALGIPRQITRSPQGFPQNHLSVWEPATGLLGFIILTGSSRPLPTRVPKPFGVLWAIIWSIVRGGGEMLEGFPRGTPQMPRGIPLRFGAAKHVLCFYQPICLKIVK